MGGETTSLWRLVVGERRRLTGAALLLTGALAVVASVVEYRVLSREIAGGDPPVLLPVREVFQLVFLWERGTEPTTAVIGYLLVLALAGIHVYYNLGFLTSHLLASSPSVGIAVWSIHGFDEYVTLTPALVFERVFPEVPVVATLGILLGLGLRLIRNPNSPSRPAEPAAPER